jgi:transposase-like protein
VLTDIGPVEIELPRDRDGSFEPVIVPKRKRRLDVIDEIVLSLSARGLTTGEFGGHFEEVYGARISNDTISTEKVAAELVEWSSRPPQVFSELKSQGVEDVLIAVCDGLKGLPEAITTTWDRTIVQQCIVHLIRNSFRYAGRQHRDGIVKGSQTRATAPSEQAANQIPRPTGGERARWTMRWKPALNAFAITFAGRFKKAPTNENRLKPTHRLSDRTPQRGGAHRKRWSAILLFRGSAVDGTFAGLRDSVTDCCPYDQVQDVEKRGAKKQ